MDPPLYSPASFDNEEVMNTTVSRLQSLFEVDRKYATNLKTEMDTFRTRMASVDPIYLRSWTEKGNGGDDEGNRVMDLESRWVQSVSALYAFAVLHKGKIAVHNGKLEIEDPQIKQEFDQLIASSKELQSEFESESSIALTHQRRAAANSGVNREAF